MHAYSKLSQAAVNATIMAVLIIALSSCKKKEELPPPDDYRVFVEASAELLCEKMLFCYEKLYRTVSPSLRKELTVENCKKTALKDLDKKLAAHTPSMKLLSVSCYRTILNTPCNKFAVVSLFEPSCSLLRQESMKVYGNF